MKAIMNARNHKKADLKKPKKVKKRTLRDRIQSAPMNLFNRKDAQGRRLCRNIFCTNLAKYNYFCSKTCKNRFVEYYEKRYIWQNVRMEVFKRDRYTCKICKVFYHPRELECDHIRPIALLEYYGYTKLNLKTFDEYIYNEKNLRTLCKECHRNITNTFMGSKKDIKKKLK